MITPLHWVFSCLRWHAAWLDVWLFCLPSFVSVRLQDRMCEFTFHVLLYWYGLTRILYTHFVVAKTKCMPPSGKKDNSKSGLNLLRWKKALLTVKYERSFFFSKILSDVNIRLIRTKNMLNFLWSNKKLSCNVCFTSHTALSLYSPPPFHAYYSCAKSL